MGKEFENPRIVSLGLESTEGIFATRGSGSVDDDDGDIEVSFEYKDHNSGSLSVIELTIYNNSKEDRYSFKIGLRLLNNLVLDRNAGQNWAGGPVHILSDTDFYVEWNSKIQAGGKQTGMNLQLIVKNGPERNGHEGAMALTTTEPVALKRLYAI